MLSRLLDPRSFRGSDSLLNPWRYPRIMFTVGSSGTSEDQFYYMHTYDQILGYTEDSLYRLGRRHQTPIKGELHLHFQGIQYFSQFIVFSKLLIIFGVHITDLGSRAPIVGTPLTALILFLSHAAKLIYTQTSNHQHTDQWKFAMSFSENCVITYIIYYTVVFFTLF